jgi:endonuclease YncB( thermonuclease family)
MRRLIVLVLFIIALPFAADAQGINPWKNRAVISVIDGDTIVLDNGEVIRLIGVLSPRAQHGKQTGEAFGEQAKGMVEDMLLGQQVDISFDRAYGPVGHRDKYGRALAYITITRGAERVFVNLELLERGAGYFVADIDDLQFSDLMRDAESKARQKKTGLWTKAEKSPVEIAAAAGKSFEEPASTINLIYIRPSKPILQGPGVNLSAAQTENPRPAEGTTKRPTSLAMEDLKKIKPVAPKEPEKPGDPDAGLYDLKSRKILVSYLDEGKKFELYQAMTDKTGTDYRVGIKDGDKEIVFITNFDGIKNLSKLLRKGTDSQPMLTAVESNVGSIGGTRGSINISSGKDGGLILNVSGRSGNARFFLKRYDALGLQIRIGNLVPAP